MVTNKELVEVYVERSRSAQREAATAPTAEIERVWRGIAVHELRIAGLMAWVAERAEAA